MTAQCFYCGEVKPCREKDIGSFWDRGMGKSIEHITFEYICRECDKAQAILRNQERLEAMKIKKINQANWRKERDKLLKQNKQ
jgi:ABC-type protease/lipase transport system fused ATPase/permease subunit